MIVGFAGTFAAQRRNAHKHERQDALDALPRLETQPGGLTGKKG